jgi:hypothetical protein
VLFSKAVTFPWTPYFHDAYAPGTDAEVVKVLIQLPLTNKAVCDDICKKALDAVLSQGADLKTTAAFLKMKDPIIEFTTAQPTLQGMGFWVFPAVAYIRDAALDLKELARSATNRPRSHWA